MAEIASPLPLGVRARRVATPRGILSAFRRYPLVPGLVLAVLIFAAIFAPWVSPMAPTAQDLRGRTAPPVWLDREWYVEHPRVTTTYFLGADHVGRDVLSRMLHGARVSLMVAIVALVAGTLSGTALGLLSGYYGGLPDELITRAVDVWNALPFLLIAILAAMTLGQSIIVVMALLAFAAWSSGVRNVRAEVLSLKTRDYVLQARICGASDVRILLRHLLPGVVNTVVVIASLRVGGLILAEAGLSFLGAGIPPPAPTWGNMISEGRNYLNTAWWIAFFPGLAIFLVVMSFNFVGDWLRDRWDPRLRQI